MDKEPSRKRPLDQDEEQAGGSKGSESAPQNTAGSMMKKVRTEDAKSVRSSSSSSAAPQDVPNTASTTGSQPSASDHSQQSSSQQQRSRPPKSLAFFGTDVMDDVVQTIGEFLFEHCHHANVEIEAKLGVLVDKNTGRRINLGVRNEAVLVPQGHPKWYNFSSDMNIDQHAHFNKKLNQRLEQANKEASREQHIRYYHTREIDQFFPTREGKARVTRDQRTNEVIPDGIVRKERIADLDVYSPRNAFDYRISVNIELPVPLPQGTPQFERHKDRISYRHNNFRIDLTQVKNANKPNGPNHGHNYSQMKPMNSNNNQDVTHELEIEFDRPQELARQREIRINSRGTQQDSFMDIVGQFVNNIRGLVVQGNISHQQQQQRPR